MSLPSVEMGESSHIPYQGCSGKCPSIGQVSLAEIQLSVLRFADFTASCHLNFATYTWGTLCKSVNPSELQYISHLRDENKNTYLAGLWGVFKKKTCVMDLTVSHTQQGLHTGSLVTHYNFLYNPSMFDKKAICQQYIQSSRTFRRCLSFLRK